VKAADVEDKNPLVEEGLRKNTSLKQQIQRLPRKNESAPD
jgi:hypothetical protein